jgi:hypothetical protein
MADGPAALAAQIAKLRELGGMVERAAPAVAVAVEREIGAQVAAGLGPDGKPLQRTQDGRQPLVGAARAIRVRALGTVIVAKVEGYHALHHMGRARGGVRRPLIPTETTTAPVARAIERTVTAEFKKTMGAR